MADVVGALGGRKNIQQLCNALLKCLSGTRRRRAQLRLELGKHVLYRIHVRAVRRQVQHFGSRLLNGLAHARHFMRGQVVHDHGVALFEFGHQHLLYPGHKRLPVDRAIEHARRYQASFPQRAHQGRRLPLSQRDITHAALAFGAAPAGGRHVRGGPGLVQKHHSVCRQTRPLLLPLRTSLRYVLALLLTGVKGLFFRLRPSRPSVFHIVVVPTRTPCSRSAHWHSCCSV